MGISIALLHIDCVYLFSMLPERDIWEDWVKTKRVTLMNYDVL